MAEAPKEIIVDTPGAIFAIIFETMLPIILSIIWIKKYGGKTSYILTGVVGFIGSVGIESIFILFFVKIFGKESNIFYLIAGISPGLFEETGKYLLIKYLFKKDQQKNIAVSYGIGHGGVESFFVGISVLAQFLMKETLIKNGTLKESVTFLLFVMGAVERLSAVTLQISLSVINYKAVKEGKIQYYFLAIILHDLIDFVAFLKAKGIVTSVYVIEFVVVLFSLCLAVYSYNLYINIIEKEKDEEKEKMIPLEEKKKSV